MLTGSAQVGRWLSVLLGIVLSVSTVFAGSRGGYVQGYARKDGTYVSGHYRSGSSSYSRSTSSSRYHAVGSHSTTSYPRHQSSQTFGSGSTYWSVSNFRDSGARVLRDADGSIHRDSTARREFMRLTGYPNGRQGYIIDHIVPLFRGGADDQSNMQWQPEAMARAKDRRE